MEYPKAQQEASDTVVRGQGKYEYGYEYTSERRTSIASEQATTENDIESETKEATRTQMGEAYTSLSPYRRPSRSVLCWPRAER